MNEQHPQQHYQPWRADQYPRLYREVVAVNWAASSARMTIDVAERFSEPPCLRISFERERAFQGIDEGYRLLDIAIGDALIYFSRNSPYLARFRQNASSTMDNFPLTHWLIVSRNQCVDVLCESEPLVATLP
jgi:hypothetical protein